MFYCSACGNSIPKNELNKTKLFIKCPNCSNVFTNPERYSTLKQNFTCFFDKYGLTVVIGIAILTIISVILIKINGDNNYDERTEKKDEKLTRIERLKNLASEVFTEHGDLELDWAIIARLQQFEEDDYGNKDVDVRLFPQELKNGGMLIFSSKFIIPEPKNNAIKDEKYGLPLSFYYRFYFNSQDSLTEKFLIVVYSSDSNVQYNFSVSPFKLLINKLMAKKKNDEWEKNRARLAARQKREQRNNETMKPAQSQSSYISKKVYHFKSKNYDIERPGEGGYTTIYEPD